MFPQNVVLGRRKADTDQVQVTTRSAGTRPCQPGDPFQGRSLGGAARRRNPGRSSVRPLPAAAFVQQPSASARHGGPADIEVERLMVAAQLSSRAPL